MIPVTLGLIRTRVRPVTALFLGWFGPRGVASILYIFTVLEAEDLVGLPIIYTAAMITVLFSIFAHGLTAAPLANLYGKRMANEEAIKPDASEKAEVSEMPLRVQPKQENAS